MSVASYFGVVVSLVVAVAAVVVALLLWEFIPATTVAGPALLSFCVFRSVVGACTDLSFASVNLTVAALLPTKLLREEREEETKESLVVILVAFAIPSLVLLLLFL